MKKALKLGTVANIGIFAHWTFLVMLAGLFVFYLYKGASIAAALAGVALISTVAACVVFHELGHALMAKTFGIRTLDITLYPIGGIARLQGLPRVPRQELLVALAGPAVNLAIAVGLFLLNALTGRPLSVNNVLAADTNVLGMLMWINLTLVGFNLLPAFPMDGGRVLRAALATRMPYRRATTIASWVGQIFSGLFLLVGMYLFNLVLIFIAVFVFIGARQEARQVAET